MPDVVAEWKHFSDELAPQDDDAEAYMRQDRMHIPFAQELFGGAVREEAVVPVAVLRPQATDITFTCSGVTVTRRLLVPPLFWMVSPRLLPSLLVLLQGRQVQLLVAADETAARVLLPATLMALPPRTNWISRIFLSRQMQAPMNTWHTSGGS